MTLPRNEPRACENSCGRNATGGRRLCWRCMTWTPAELAPAGRTERWGPDGTYKGSSVRYTAPKPKVELSLARPTPVIVRPTWNYAFKTAEDLRVAAFVPDPQIGGRWVRTADGGWELQTFHDVDAMAWAAETLAGIQGISYVVHLGDFLDLPQLSRWPKEPGHSNTLQDAVQAGYHFLRLVQAATPGADTWLLEGNHDERMKTMLMKHLPDLAFLRSANGGHPALSVPGLLELDDLGITYVSGYPATELWLTDHLRAIHGSRVGRQGATAALVAEDSDVNTVFGHVHRAEFAGRTLRVGRSGHRQIFAASPGCLCKITGEVPSFHAGLTHDGEPAKLVENWQHGLGIATWTDDRPDKVTWRWIPR